MSETIFPLEKAPNKTVRPADLEIEEKETYILDLLGAGETMAGIERELNWSKSAIFQYGERNVSFREKVHRARIAGMDSLVDQLQTIPDEEPDTNKARLKCENIRWVASRLNRQKYGDKVDISMTHSIDLEGAIAEASQRVEHKRAQLLGFTGEVTEAELIVDEDETSIFD